MQNSTTQWVAYVQYGSYFRLYEWSLQACPMLIDGSMESEESACDVDYYNCEQQAELVQVAKELGNAYWPSEPPRD